MTDDIAATEDEETEDDDLLADLEDEDDGPEVEVEPVAKATKKAKPKVVEAPKADPSQAELAALGLNALKQSWVAEAKAAGHAAADFSAMGLTGIDDEAKSAFLAEAAQSHETRVKELAAVGFVFKPEGDLDSKDEIAKAEWGKTGPGLVADGDEKTNERIADEVKAGNVMGVIQNLPELGSFFLKGRRG